MDTPSRSLYGLAPSEMAVFAVTIMQTLRDKGPKHLLIIPQGGNIKFTPKQGEVSYDPQEGGIWRKGAFNIEVETWTPPTGEQSHGHIRQSQMWNRAPVKARSFDPKAARWDLEQRIRSNLWTLQNVLEIYLKKASQISRRKLRRHRDVPWLVCLHGMVAALKMIRSTGVCELTQTHCYIVLNELRVQAQECQMK